MEQRIVIEPLIPMGEPCDCERDEAGTIVMLTCEEHAECACCAKSPALEQWLDEHGYNETDFIWPDDAASPGTFQ